MQIVRSAFQTLPLVVQLITVAVYASVVSEFYDFVMLRLRRVEAFREFTLPAGLVLLLLTWNLLLSFTTGPNEVMASSVFVGAIWIHLLVVLRPRAIVRRIKEIEAAQPKHEDEQSPQ